MKADREREAPTLSCNRIAAMVSCCFFEAAVMKPLSALSLQQWQPACSYNHPAISITKLGPRKQELHEKCVRPVAGGAAPVTFCTHMWLTKVEKVVIGGKPKGQRDTLHFSLLDMRVASGKDPAVGFQ